MYKCCKCGRSINAGDKYFDLNGDKPWETVEICCLVCVKELDKDALIEMFNIDRDKLLEMIDDLFSLVRTI